MSEKAAAAVHPLTMTIDRRADLVVVRCSGRLVAGVSDGFCAEIKQLIPSHNRIELDLQDLTHMDSMGLGALVRLYVSAKSSGCVLQLNNLGKPIRHLLGVTHLLSVLEVVGENNIRF